MPDRLRAALLLGLGLALSCAAAAQTKLFRWVDDQGVVHYSDRLPAEATGKASAQMNRQGTVVKRHPAALTPEQLAVREAEQQKLLEEGKRKREEARKNEALLKTYASVDDIDGARERALANNREAVQSAQHNLTQAETRRDELTQQAAKYEKAGKPVPAKLQREIKANEAELQSHRNLFEAKQRDVNIIMERYDADKRRYIQLTSDSR